MCGQESKSYLLASPSLIQQLAYGDDVAEALRHLLAARHRQEAVMDPVAGERRAGVGAAALGNLVLVVGEDEIESAAVYVDRLAEVTLNHRRAFDVPAGTT